MNIIEFENVNKNYKIYYGNISARNALSDLFRQVMGKEALHKKEFSALKNVNFSIQKGNTVGIIGSNGSGKSTILKLITKVTFPTSGTIKIKGRVASLLELGAGFHLELTGRENIYLNASLLGLKKKEIDEKLEEIIEFSELRQFIDTPIKKYSSGMYVKLGFSIAIHVNPEILLVDEVLSVGDAHFQNKCIKKMRSIVTDANKTVILVSHNMVTVQALCDKALWVEKGIFRDFDETNKVINKYLEEVNKRDKLNDNEGNRAYTSDIYTTEIKTLNTNEKVTSGFSSNETILIKLKYNVIKPLDDVLINLFIEAIDLGLPISSISTKNLDNLNLSVGEHTLFCELKLKELYPREFSIRVSITSKDMLINYDTWYDSCRFSIIEDDNTFSLSNATNDIIKLDYNFLNRI